VTQSDGTGSVLFPSTFQYTQISGTESNIAQSIAQWVDRRIDIAEAIRDGEEEVGYRIGKERLPTDDQIIGCPSDDEGEENSAERLCSLALLFPFVLSTFLFLLDETFLANFVRQTILLMLR